MPRDKTTRFVLALAALLVALQFIGVMVPGATGHAIYSPAPAPMEWSTSVVTADLGDEFATCGDGEQIVDPASWLGGRDRHRSAPEPDTRPCAGGVRGDEFTALPPGGLTVSHLAARSSAPHSLTSLQVFRC
ncbi:hypothetical protein [Streptomyces scopuliridis]|uniref:Uncharacterized protein n=1 Tax=Streptomyces scopuliridis RB72 TaxID=1440053 RepID=A0A2T7T9R4_9ACTN|nr:hypothetical protein [Streptomyces scopuliridis]PVE11831.1 hypothetical protein Y717_00200 [Streptomyces scopuliridis RB72]